MCFVIKLCIKIYKRKTQYADINKFKNINKTKKMRRIILALILIFPLLITAQTNSESESIKNSLDVLLST